jgi:two-component system response regulator TtrR
VGSELPVCVVDDDAGMRDSLRWLLEGVGMSTRLYESGQAFLAEGLSQAAGCLLLDIRLRDMNGLDLYRELKRRGFVPPVIFITGHGDISLAVQAMKDGALDFVTKPLDDQKLLDSVRRALAIAGPAYEEHAQRGRIRERLASLSAREREVLDRVVAGKMNKVIADELNISSKTVEVHRARVMEKMHARSLAELVRQLSLLGAPDQGNP